MNQVRLKSSANWRSRPRAACFGNNDYIIERGGSRNWVLNILYPPCRQPGSVHWEWLNEWKQALSNRRHPSNERSLRYNHLADSSCRGLSFHRAGDWSELPPMVSVTAWPILRQGCRSLHKRPRQPLTSTGRTELAKRCTLFETSNASPTTI